MPKVRGLTDEQRAALLSDAVSGDDAAPIDLPPSVLTAPAVVVTPPVEPQTDMQALVAALVAGLTQANAGTAQAIKEALSDASVMAREPIPENKQATGISVYSHPEGDLKHPRTKLRCPMFLGVIDPETMKVVPAFEIFEDTSTEFERVSLNQLRTGSYFIERNDDIVAKCRVFEQQDDLGQPIRLTIGVPQTWLAKDQFAQMPSMKSLLTQLLAPAEAAA